MAGRKLIGNRLWIAAVAAAGLTATLWLTVGLFTPYAPVYGEQFVDLPRGISSREIAKRLEQAGVIRHSWQFLLVRLLRPAVLQAGEYRFAEPATVFTVYDRIAKGDVYYWELVVPEGSNLFDISESLDQLGLIRAEEFRKAALDPTLIRDLAPQAPSLEGYLFPATYRLTRHTKARELTKEMTERFRRAWKQLNTSAEVHRTVTLASLIEKETSVAEERTMVASVFWNRLARGMKLDCDPTTIYAALLEGRYQGTLLRSDLESRHPYNTYQHPGLPPGPIANPGLASLKAALQPAATNYLYFVAKPDGKGSHVFSTNLDAHRRAVAEYRRGQQKAEASPAPRRVSRPGRSRGD